MRVPLTLALAAVLASAHEPFTTKLTWSAEIVRIVQKRCMTCHREGGPAPMPLTSYEAARPWAKAMRDEVLSRRMPPWGAVKGFGDFRDDPSLTQDEIARIAEWVEGGAPEGDIGYLPPSQRQAAAHPNLPAGVRARRLAARSRSTLLGIKPLADARNTKITAVRPDGTVLPLLWLLDYRTRWGRTFVYQVPVTLPAGTKVHSAVPVELLLKPQTQAR